MVPVSDEEMEALPVLVTALNYGKGAKQESIQVDLEAELTAVGTIALACGSRTSPHRWKMEFAVEEVDGGETADYRESSLLDTHLLEAAGKEIQRAFRGEAEPSGLMRRLETELQQNRSQWSVDTLRGLWPLVLEVASERTRRRSARGSLVEFGGVLPASRERTSRGWDPLQGALAGNTERWCSFQAFGGVLERVVGDVAPGCGGLEPGQQSEIWGQANRLLGGKKVDARKWGEAWLKKPSCKNSGC